MKLRRKPSARPAQRYVFFRVLADGPVAFDNLKDVLLDVLEGYLGAAGLAASGAVVMRSLWDPKARTGAVRCGPKYVDAVKVALALAAQVGDQPVIVRSVRVSGTVRAGRTAISGRH